MNNIISRYFFYHPTTVVKGEPVFYFLKKYRKFQWLSQQEIEAHQLDALRRLCNRVSAENPFYKKLYGSAGAKITTLEDLKTLPTLSKELLIQQNASISSGMSFFTSSKTTGGSTGEPVKLFKTSIALARERAATWRAYEWAGVSIGDPQARFWGIPHSQQDKLKARIIDFVANRERLSAFEINPQNLRKYYDRLAIFSPAYLYGYVSAILEFANFLLEARLPPPPLKAVITTSEVLTTAARETISSAFNTRVFNEYGCGEVGSIAHECEHGRMHVMADNLIVEIDSQGDLPGEIIVTDLYNTATPLIRYRLGDFASFDHTPCPCGRQLPVLKSIHGRAYDLIQTTSGTQIHPEAVIYVFENIQKKTLAFKQFQAIQTSVDKMTIKIVPTENFEPSAMLQIINDLKTNVSSEIDYEVSLCTDIARERSGKMRLVKGLTRV